MSRTGNPPDDLPYSVELWAQTDRDKIERVLARACNGELAKAIFTAARDEFPERRLTLSKDGRVVADSEA
jgi:hypothetical protein